MSLDILRKSGGWCVELQLPLKTAAGKEISQIEIRRPRADNAIRWNERRYASTLALLSELCDVPENLLRELTTEDFDRVMLAFYNVVPKTIQTDFAGGMLPLATPEEESRAAPDWAPPPDQQDPRFPKVEGPVQRMPQPARPAPTPLEEEQGMSLEPAAQLKRVGT